MPKRFFDSKGNQDRGQNAYDGDRMGLTEAFAPIDVSAFSSSNDPWQSFTDPIDADQEEGYKEEEPTIAVPAEGSYDGNPIGLTQAFAPISDDAFTSRKGRHFKHAPIDFEDFDDDAEDDDQDMPAGRHGKHGGRDTAAAATADDDAFENFMNSEPARGRHGRHGKRAASVEEAPAPVVDPAEVPTGFDSEGNASAPSAFNSFDAPMPSGYEEMQRKSTRSRILLSMLALLLVAGLVIGGYFAYQEIISGNEAGERTSEDLESEGEQATEVKTTEVPNLAALLGVTTDDAVVALGRGATVMATRPVEDDKIVKSAATIELTDEPADERSGAPNVYLSLNKKGKAVTVGYSAGVASLGYGSQSFEDAVNNSHIIEETLRAAGVEVEDGVAVLPEDEAEYRTFNEADPTVVDKERYSFSGKGKVGSEKHKWTAVLLYDYVGANASGKLSDTVRTIYIYLEA